jgi:hypothetical protein
LQYGSIAQCSYSAMLHFALNCSIGDWAIRW